MPWCFCRIQKKIESRHRRKSENGQWKSLIKDAGFYYLLGELRAKIQAGVIHPFKIVFLLCVFIET